MCAAVCATVCGTDSLGPHQIVPCMFNNVFTCLGLRCGERCVCGGMRCDVHWYIVYNEVYLM